MEIESGKEEKPQLTYHAKPTEEIKDFINSMLTEILKGMTKPIKSFELWTNVFFGELDITIGVLILERGYIVREISSRGRMVKQRLYGLENVCELNIRVTRYSIVDSENDIVSFSVSYEPYNHQNSSRVIKAIDSGFNHRIHQTHHLNNYYTKKKSPTNKWS